MWPQQGSQAKQFKKQVRFVAAPRQKICNPTKMGAEIKDFRFNAPTKKHAELKTQPATEMKEIGGRQLGPLRRKMSGPKKSAK